MRLLLPLALLLCSCASTAELAAKRPFSVVHSAKNRDTIAECLLNRVTTDDLLPKKEVGAGFTTVSFDGRGLAARPSIYQFLIRDEGSGSVVEVRRFAHASLAAAETCF